MIETAIIVVCLFVKVMFDHDKIGKLTKQIELQEKQLKIRGKVIHSLYKSKATLSKQL